MLRKYLIFEPSYSCYAYKKKNVYTGKQYIFIYFLTMDRKKY